MQTSVTVLLFLQVCVHETEMKIDIIWLSCVFYTQFSLWSCWKQRSILILYHKESFLDNFTVFNLFNQAEVSPSY